MNFKIEYLIDKNRIVTILQEIQDTGQLNKAFLSELPMTANIAEQTRDFVVWL